MKSKNSHFNNFNIKSMSRLFVLLMIAFSMATFIGCGSDNSTSTNPPPDNDPDDNPPADTQGPNDVWIQSSSFNVANLEIEAGTTVTWTNKSSMDHTVTSGTRGGDNEGDLFDRTVGPGETFSFTFEDAGSYEYFCRFHSGMDAEVTVTESS